MAVGDLFMLSLHQSYGAGGKACDTVWSYRALTDAATAGQLIVRFTEAASVLAKMALVQTEHIKNVSARCINLFSLTDFSEVNLTGGGAATSDTLPRFNAYKYTLRLNTRGIRPGGKSIRGVAEAATTNGIVVDAAYLTALEALRVAIGAPLTASGVDQFEPVVIGRILMPPDDDHAEEWYRLPATAGEANYGRVVAVQFNPKVGHQTTGE